MDELCGFVRGINELPVPDEDDLATLGVGTEAGYRGWENDSEDACETGEGRDDDGPRDEGKCEE